ncbi:hypothetical protein BSKO_12102 [Bryopsis sp. KO-2023]|nr:hypothetical protein BSKO_12102 [Bryopsis sp. KO-2023]
MNAEESKESSSGLEFKLHPLVLINIGDHHTRVKVNSNDQAPQTVLGCLLGAQSGREVDISNSFEIMYTLVEGNPVVDWVFLQERLEQYKTVFPSLDLVGWYSTGLVVGENEITIHRKMMEMTESPIFLTLDSRIDHSRKDLPVSMFETELHVIDGVPSFIFVKASYSIATSEAERVGVDQVAKILPSGKGSGSDQLTAHLVGMHSAMKMLIGRLGVLTSALEKMESGEVPFDHSLVREISSLINKLPVMDTGDFQSNFMTEYIDALLTIHLSNLTKGTNLVNDIVDKSLVVLERPRRKFGHLM